MVGILCTINIYAVDAITACLAVYCKVSSINQTVGTPLTLFAYDNLSIWRAHTHCNVGRNAHIHWAVEIYLELMLAHTKWWQHIKFILCITAVYNHLPHNAVSLGIWASEHI